MYNNEDLGLYLQQKEVASLLGITPQSVSKLIREHHIETYKKGNRLQLVLPDGFREILSLKRLNLASGVIAVHIVKGGVGKTTLVHSLASRAVALGHRVLMVDLDQQGNLSHSFGVWPKLGIDPTLLNVYEGEIKGRAVSIEDTIVELTNDLHIIPANLSLASFDGQLTVSTENLGSLFEEMFAPIRDNYDLIFIDAPPALSKITAAVHCFVDTLIMPVNADAFSLEGLQLTMDHLDMMRKKFRVNPEISIVLNKFFSQHKMTIEVLKVLSENYGEHLAETFIAGTKKIENSIASNSCVWTDRVRNNALEDMDAYLSELLGLEQWADEWKSKKINFELDVSDKKTPRKSNVSSKLKKRALSRPNQSKSRETSL
ncbi:MAG: AAA family ATPase [Flavobacteriaceae bacterium]